LIELDFPLKAAAEAPPPDGLAAALGATFASGPHEFDWLAEVESEKVLRGLKLDFAALARLPVRGNDRHSRLRVRFDFVSRFFAPAVGVPEDSGDRLGPLLPGRLVGPRLGKPR